MEKVGCTRQYESELSLRSFAQPFPSGDKGCANRPFNSLYDPFGSPCRGQKRCSNRFAIRLADHQRSTPAAELRFLCGDEPAFTQGFAKGLLARCFFLKSTRPSLPLKKGLSKTHQSSLTLKGGSTAFPKPLSPQGTGDVPTALSIVFTTPSVPLVGDRNGAQTATL